MRTLTFRRSVVIALLAAALAACGGGGSGGTKYLLLAPTRFGTSDLYLEDFNPTPSGGGTGPGGEATAALIAAGVGQGQNGVIVGWESYSDESIPEDQGWGFTHNSYRGAVLFNLAGLTTDKMVVSADLQFNVLAAKHLRLSGPSPAEARTTPMRVGLGDTDWHGLPEVPAPPTIPGNAYPSYPDGLPFGGGYAPILFRVEVDVTAAVVKWQSDPLSNHGFVLRGDPEVTAVLGSNEAAWEVLGDFELRIDYKPK